ncbi:hypothetical protein BDF20DRAFT_832326 [Mycotypha africana]|uniref:uncharacterized protein n=1 Tax=Mycotypha africana TaxID=64632 RepID=UPI002301482E|nr:uncharacterized protein BDF20DRAFT_832326 [Mycotypha africana]KAI8987384.1 hypothetical protein BDF20DRAFT_832326 [Mycotypha africana]
MNKEDDSPSHVSYVSSIDKYMKRAEALKQKARANLLKLANHILKELAYDLEDREEELQEIMEDIEADRIDKEDLDDLKYTMSELAEFIDNMEAEIDVIRELKCGLGFEEDLQRFCIKDIKDEDRAWSFKEAMKDYNQSERDADSEHEEGEDADKTNQTIRKEPPHTAENAAH